MHPWHFYLCCEGVLRSSHLVTCLFYQCMTFCNTYKLCSKWHWPLNSLQWPIYNFTSVDNTKLPCKYFPCCQPCFKYNDVTKFNSLPFQTSYWSDFSMIICIDCNHLMLLLPRQWEHRRKLFIAHYAKWGKNFTCTRNHVPGTLLYIIVEIYPQDNIQYMYWYDDL